MQQSLNLVERFWHLGCFVLRLKTVGELDDFREVERSLRHKNPEPLPQLSVLLEESSATVHLLEKALRGEMSCGIEHTQVCAAPLPSEVRQCEIHDGGNIDVRFHSEGENIAGTAGPPMLLFLERLHHDSKVRGHGAQLLHREVASVDVERTERPQQLARRVGRFNEHLQQLGPVGFIRSFRVPQPPLRLGLFVVFGLGVVRRVVDHIQAVCCRPNLDRDRNQRHAKGNSATTLFLSLQVVGFSGPLGRRRGGP
mmetsp:Transcript_7797/g.18773  ORF Transcript_7797/g.18773 Transcript_7797/m.18773 type:complete len:254 (-) Transcript_7797:165-926(-)